MRSSDLRRLELAQRFIQYDGHGIGQIERADAVIPQGDADDPFGVLIEQFLR